MKVKIVSKTVNPLLGRTEAWFSIDQEGPTPPELEVLKALARSLKTRPENIILARFRQKHGVRQSEGLALIHKKKVRELPKPKEKKKEEAAAPEAAAAEEKKEEAPAEEPAEEKKEEAPTEASEEKKE